MGINNTASTNRFKFFKAGGFDQVLIETGADLAIISKLDRKLWSALSSPVNGVEFDKKTLQYIDTDSDGHIRAPELVAAVEWLSSVLVDLSPLPATDGLPLSAIDQSKEEGKRLYDAAAAILRFNGKEPDRITLADVDAREKMLESTRLNGDGVILPASADDSETSSWITDIISAVGGTLDRSGESGIDKEHLDTFSLQAEQYLKWLDERPKLKSSSMPDNEEDEAVLLYCTIKDKIEDYFIRCNLAAFDKRGENELNAPLERLQELSKTDLSKSLLAVSDLPISEVSAKTVLKLNFGINPAWKDKLSRFIALVSPLTGNAAELDEEKWITLKEELDPLLSWLDTKPATGVETLGDERLREWDNETQGKKISELIDKDAEQKPLFDTIEDVEKLLRYALNLLDFANNYVAFRDFYTGRGKALFQSGTLYMDGRSFDLCIKVLDVAKHATLANLAGIYILYCDCVKGDKKMTVAAAVTNGDSDQLMVGRNGIFFDREGNDWDACVVRIVDHPISLRQAFWGPYKRIMRTVGEQMQKLAAARAKAAEEKAAGAIINTGTKAGEAKQQQTFDVARFAGIFAAIGLAVGAIGTAIASVLTGFLKLLWWQMPLAVIGIMLLISGPSMIIAWFKLRQRNLGRLLDANGWAVNTRARINIPFGASLTSIAKLPAGSSVSFSDPFAEKKRGFGFWIIAAILIAFFAILQKCSWNLSMNRFPF